MPDKYTFFVQEMNSGGYTVCLGVLSDRQPHWVEIEATSVDDAIAQFEAHFSIDWDYENSYEGNSCNCCGRRFSIFYPKDMPAKLRDSRYDFPEADWYEGVPYFAEYDPNWPQRVGCNLADCPVPAR